MNNRRLTTGLWIALVLSGLTACQTRTKSAEQSANMRLDTTVFDDDTLEGAIKDSVRPQNHKN